MSEKQVAGYEWGVCCPECGHWTDAAHNMSDDGTIECGDPYLPGGCGRTLKIYVEVVGGDAR